MSALFVHVSIVYILLVLRHLSCVDIDMQLLFSMVFNSASLLNGNEHWIPLCLPKFNAKGFLHTYIWAEDLVAIILISADKNAFFNMREIKERVHGELSRNGIWDRIISTVRRGRYMLCIDIRPP